MVARRLTATSFSWLVSAAPALPSSSATSAMGMGLVSFHSMKWTASDEKVPARACSPLVATTNWE